MSLFSKIFMLVALLVAPDASSKKMLGDAYEATREFCSECYYNVMENVVDPVVKNVVDNPVVNNYFPDHHVDTTRQTPLIPTRFLAAASSVGLVGLAAFYKNKEWLKWATEVVRDIPALGKSQNALVSAALAYGILAGGASVGLRTGYEGADVMLQGASRIGGGNLPTVLPSVWNRLMTPLHTMREAIPGAGSGRKPKHQWTWRSGAKGLLTAASLLSAGALAKKAYYRG